MINKRPNFSGIIGTRGRRLLDDHTALKNETLMFRKGMSVVYSRIINKMFSQQNRTSMSDMTVLFFVGWANIDDGDGGGTPT